MNRTIQRGIWTLAGTLWALVCGTVVADDTELFVVDSSQFPDTRPNVLLIMDTSGSMADRISTQPIFDPSQDYGSSPCDPSRVYWENDDDDIPDCSGPNGNDWISMSAFHCDAAAQAFMSAGYYIDRMAQYDANYDERWEDLRASEHDRPVECRDDSGIHGDGADDSLVYAQDDDNNALWTDDENDEIDWGDFDHISVYHPNYLNWYHGPANDLVPKIDIVKDVATNLVDTVNGINIGLMRFNWNESSNGSDSGGAVVYAVENISTARTALNNAIDALPADGNTPLSETMYEAMRYYRGMDVLYGDLNAPQNSVAAARNPSDPEAESYRTPIEYACQRNFIVYLSDGLPTSDSGADNAIENIIDGDCSGNCLDELAEYLYEFDQSPDGGGGHDGLQNIITHTIGFAIDIPVLEQAAEKGGGRYFQANNTAELSAALTRIVTDILNVQATFTAPTVSINSFNRTQHLNDLYITMFEPSGDVHWPGNLKKYRLRPSDAMIVDSDGIPAVEGSFFSSTSHSFWSPTPDGDDVTSGGAASKIPAPASRNVYTCLGCASSRVDLTSDGNEVSTDNVLLDETVFEIGGSGDPTLTSLISFIRGVDVTNVDGDEETTDQRNQLGDPLHAQPATVTYSDTESIIFFATNDGHLHAFDTEDGVERWVFIPEEFLPDQAVLYDNDSVAQKHYGIDGSLRVQVIGDNDAEIDPADERVYIYFGMRRGGDMYYALDVTDPDNPDFLWKKASGDLPTGLGQTWSNPVPTRIDVTGGTYSGSNGDNEEKLVLVFGAGYDSGHDQPGLPTTPDAGNGIAIVDAVNGNVLWHATKGGGSMSGSTSLDDMNYSFPGDIKVVDLDGDRFADRMYAADMGGQIWRFDITNGSTASELVAGGVIAQLGIAPNGDPDDYANARRFYYAPDVAIVNSGTHNFMHIGIGSGHRASPNSELVHDRFFALRDANPFLPLTQPEFSSYDVITEGDLVDVSDTLNPTFTDDKDGWYIDLRSSDGETVTWEGEKVLSEARTFANQIFFTSFTPGATVTANDCQPRLGTNKLYIIDLFTGAPVTNLDSEVSNDPDNLTIEDRALEFGGSITSSPVFLFPSPEDDPNGEPCVGSECTPEPVVCVDLFCFPPGFANDPVRTFWSQESLDE